MGEQRQGLILKGIGGLYSVEAADGIYDCRARGIFRKSGITPVAGDMVLFSVLPDGTGTLEEILPRRNLLIRPPVANLDCLVIVAAVVQPLPHLLVIDKMTAIAEAKGIEPLIVLNKADLEDTAALEAIYRKSGLEVFVVSAADGRGLEPLRRRLEGRISAFTGNSGVGKSSLLNRLEGLVLETGEISRKLGRGRHTTRSTALFRLENGGYIVDTPGFSSLDMERLQRIRKEELSDCFREFAPYLGHCRFHSCAHVSEPGCAVRAAVEAGEIADSRYESYLAMYQEAKTYKEWED